MPLSPSYFTSPVQSPPINSTHAANPEVSRVSNWHNFFSADRTLLDCLANMAKRNPNLQNVIASLHRKPNLEISFSFKDRAAFDKNAGFKICVKNTHGGVYVKESDKVGHSHKTRMKIVCTADNIFTLPEDVIALAMGVIDQKSETGIWPTQLVALDRSSEEPVTNRVRLYVSGKASHEEAENPITRPKQQWQRVRNSLPFLAKLGALKPNDDVVDARDMFNQFGNRMIEELFSNRPPLDNKKSVLITHSFPTELIGMKAAQKISDNGALVILKSSSQQDETKKNYIEGQVKTLALSKKDFTSSPQKVIETIQSTLSDDENLMVLDHGGYFAYHLSQYLKALPISSITEYGLNGEVRYAENMPEDDLTVFSSVAVSRLKHIADKACGELIGERCLNIMEDASHEMDIPRANDLKIGVIGLGKLSGGALSHMRTRGIETSNIFVSDIDPKKHDIAKQEGFQVQEASNQFLEQSHLVILGVDKIKKESAAPLTDEMFDSLPKGKVIFIAGVTSPDDTMDLDGLIERKVLAKKNPITTSLNRVSSYETRNGAIINLIDNGEAPNLSEPVFGIRHPGIFIPQMLHALVAYETTKDGKPLSEEKIKKLESEVLDVYKKTINQYFSTHRDFKKLMKEVDEVDHNR